MNEGPKVRIEQAGPLITIQDAGRFGMLRYGIGESGPMDRGAFHLAGTGLARAGAAIEITTAGLQLRIEGGSVVAGWAGGGFVAAVNGAARAWPGSARLTDGDRIAIHPGPFGNYGYIRFDREIGVPVVLGSRATNATVGLGGFEGRALRAGDVLPLFAGGAAEAALGGPHSDGPIRVVWGIHAELFPAGVRERFVADPLTISPHMDRMGVRFSDEAGVFKGFSALSLVSDAVVCGDIQILGDGTPIALMRDHQPTGGYPRIATIIAADLDRFVQMRPGTQVRFRPVTPEHALAALRGEEKSR